MMPPTKQGEAIKLITSEQIPEVRYFIEKQEALELHLTRNYDNLYGSIPRLEIEILLQYPFNFAYLRKNKVIGYLRMLGVGKNIVVSHLAASSPFIAGKLFSFIVRFIRENGYSAYLSRIHKENKTMLAVLKRHVRNENLKEQYLYDDGDFFIAHRKIS